MDHNRVLDRSGSMVSRPACASECLAEAKSRPNNRLQIWFLADGPNNVRRATSYVHNGSSFMNMRLFFFDMVQFIRFPLWSPLHIVGIFQQCEAETITRYLLRKCHKAVCTGLVFF